MRILVTGGAGFIGSHYVRQLLTDAYPGYAGAQVTVYDKLTYAGNLANLESVSDSPRYRFVQGDVAHRREVLQIAGVGQLVVDGDRLDVVGVSPGERRTDVVGADEAGTPGHKQSHEVLSGRWVRAPRRGSVAGGRRG